VGLLFLIHAGLLVYGAWLHSPGWDELGHLPAGLAHWLYGDFRFYRVNPPLVRMVATLPLLLIPPQIDWESIEVVPHGRPEFTVSNQLFEEGFERGCWYFTIARWACLPFSLVGGLVVFWWSRSLFGNTSAILAVWFWCLSPLILTNAQMITPDVGAAVMGLAAQYAFWRWLRQPEWSKVFVCSLLLGLALLTKFTLLVLPPLWCGLWLIVRNWRSHSTQGTIGPGMLREAFHLVMMFTLALYIINLAYNFDGSFKKLLDYTFVSRALSGVSNEDSDGWGNRFADTWLGKLPVPFPEQYILGIDFQKREFERGYMSYLCGNWKHGGWWYYYIYGLIVKEPLGFWILFVLAVAVAAGGQRFRISWRDEIVVWAPAVMILTLVSSQTGFNHHLRYVLPCMPFAFIVTSRIGIIFEVAPVGCSKAILRILVGLALGWFTLSSLRYANHSHAYFNELAGGPANGHSHLLDSNIDWGQDLLPLKRWLDAHPQIRLSGVAYSVPGSFVQLEKLGPGFDRLPPRLPPGRLSQAVHFEPGWYVVFVRELREHNSPYAYFLQLEPEARIGWTAYIYHLTEEKIEALVQSR